MNKEHKNMIKNITGIFLIIATIFLSGVYGAQIVDNILRKSVEYDMIIEDTLINEQQIIKTKQDIDYTGTVQDTLTTEEIMLSKEPDCIYYDTIKAQREQDSIDAFMRYWYEVLDTNSDGDIDILDYEMDCGGNDSLIEWLEE